MSDILERVNNLFKLPQHLCHMCGNCCKIATFKGGLSYEEVKELASSKDAEESQVLGARDFLTIFQPYEAAEDAKKVAPEFVEMIYETFGKDSKVGFFHCKFLGQLGEKFGCRIHEDRPQLCRMYPIPHERTFYFPGCGFEKQGRKNWQEIKNIMDSLEEKRYNILQEQDAEENEE